MDDLPTQLRALIEHAAEPVTRDEVIVLTGGSAGPAGHNVDEPGTRRRFWWLAVAAVVAVVVGLAALVAVGDDRGGPEGVTTEPVDDPSGAIVAAIEEATQITGLEVGDPCPPTERTGTGPDRPFTPMRAVLAGDPSIGTCRVVAWVPVSADLVMFGSGQTLVAPVGLPLGWYDQDGRLLWDLRDPSAAPAIPAPPDQATAEASQPSDVLSEIEPGLPFQRPVYGPRQDGTVGYIGVQSCMTWQPPLGGGGLVCYAEQLTDDAKDFGAGQD